MQAALALQAAGYANLASVAGGHRLWIAEQLPVVKPELDADRQDFNERYSRHLLLPPSAKRASSSCRLRGCW